MPGMRTSGARNMSLPATRSICSMAVGRGMRTVPSQSSPSRSMVQGTVPLAPETSRRRLLPEWNAVIGADALGALLWNAPSRFINPVVYVPSAGTLVREHGCGSGTAAIGSWLAAAAGETVEMPIHQPGGTILVRAAMLKGRLTVLTINGRVKLVDEGMVEV